MKETKLELLRRLFTENNLAQEDVFKMKMGGKEIPIITRTGIDKIVAKNNIELDYIIENLAPDNKTVVIRCIATMGQKKCVTFGESSPSNTKQAYPVAMAEKRAKSRAVLTLAGFYEQGVMSEDENDDFDTEKNKLPHELWIGRIGY